jgi:hypothetical protein
MQLILFLLTVPVLIYTIRSRAKTNTVLTKLARSSRGIFIGLFLLYAFLLLIENYNYYLIGYRSTSIVYIFSALAGIVYVLADTRTILVAFKRILLNLIALGFMAGLPFLIIEIFLDFQDQLIYSNYKFRLEMDNRGMMSPCGLPVLFEKNFPIERKLIPETDTCISAKDVLKVNINPIDSGCQVTYFLMDGDNKDSIYRLNVIYRMPKVR